ncbi:hypothetical protein J7E22_15665 [Curtobacterium sp. ISL-83]|nr:hypothetical protein [Curtobacterium sp. ISL-83]
MDTGGPDNDAPDAATLRAFGVAGSVPERLAGGQGTTWRAGDLVFRPHGNAAEAAWRSGVLATLEHTSAFHTPRPVPTADGHWTRGPWEAWEWVPGTADATRVAEVLRAGAAFHRAVAHLARPSFLDRTVDPWSRADRMVWDEAPVPDAIAHDVSVRRLSDAFRPVDAPRQLIHRDLLGNVLFADGQPPTVIDWAPSWRPSGFGAAIAAVDAVCWHGVPVARLASFGVGVDGWSQLLVRALAFRVVTLHLLGAWDDRSVALHRPVVDALV